MNKTQPRDAAFKETNDLAFAAYAHMQGLKVVKAVEWKRGRAVEYKFTFDDPPTVEDPEGRWDALQIDFVNSEALQFDLSVRTLKKLCKRSYGE
jgi:hypothetical protein